MPFVCVSVFHLKSNLKISGDTHERSQGSQGKKPSPAQLFVVLPSMHTLCLKAQPSLFIYILEQNILDQAYHETENILNVW